MLFHRRTALASGIAALGTAGFATGAPVLAAQPPAGSQNASFYRFKVGDAEVTAINDGFFQRELDGFIRNATLDEVKSALAAEFLPTDKFVVPFTTLVVNTGGKLVLLDTGNGDTGAPTSGTWMANFRAAGFDPANVDIVLISHFHGDHINGLRLKDGTARFPRAEVKVHEREWDFWMDDTRAAAAPDGMKPAFANTRRVFTPMAKDVTRFAWEREIAPGITAVAAPGHTPGHTAFAITAGGGRLLAMSDTANNPQVFVRNPDWSAIFDMDGDVARASRHKLLDMAASERLQTSFYHASFPATGFIARDGATRYRMIPAGWQSTI